MAQQTPLRILVEDCESAAKTLVEAHAEQHGRAVLAAARILASRGAMIVSRLGILESEDLAGWTAAVDRASQNGRSE